MQSLNFIVDLSIAPPLCRVGLLCRGANWEELKNIMALKKEIERMVKTQEFQQDMEYLLSPQDREYIHYILKEFRSYKNVSVLVRALTSCLDTPQKLNLLPTIRELLPKSNRKEFDQLAPYKKMAHSYTPHQKPTKRTRSVWVKRRRRSQPLGFSIRGGKGAGIGIFVSQVEQNSIAFFAGLKVGDQILSINDINFEWISHESAVMVVKAFDEMKLVVTSAGRLPQLENDTDTSPITW